MKDVMKELTDFGFSGDHKKIKELNFTNAKVQKLIPELTHKLFYFNLIGLQSEDRRLVFRISYFEERNEIHLSFFGEQYTNMSNIGWNSCFNPTGHYLGREIYRWVREEIEYIADVLLRDLESAFPSIPIKDCCYIGQVGS